MKKVLRTIAFSFLTIILAMVFNLNVHAAGENISTSIPVNLGKSFSGTAYGNGTYYKFQLPRNSIVKIEVTTGGIDQRLKLDLLNSNGDGLPVDAEAMTTDRDYNRGYQKVNNKIGLNKGTYYFKVTTYYGDRVDYKVKISVVTKQTSTVKVAGFKNNYKSSALPFNVGNKLTSVIQKSIFGQAATQQFYKFKVSTGRTVYMKFFTPANGENDHLYFNIFNSAGKNIHAEKIEVFSNSGENTASLKKYLKKGTYYICVDNYTSFQPTYSIKTAYKPYSTKITGLSSNSKKTMLVKWKKKSSTSGYQIMYSRNSNFKNAKTVKVNASNGSKKIKGLTSGKRYYVKVRRYKKSFGITYYSDWSNKKSVKIK